MPPTISNFNWQPSRIVNGKVYDATMAFNVESTTPITSLNATLGGYAPTIPPRAYPAENPVTLQLGSVPQTTSVTTYSAKVTNLKGGKQYKLITQAKNQVGLQTAEFETPYVRELENIAESTGILVGATYHPWFENPCVHYCHWPELSDNVMPLLGLYNSNDPLVVSKHIDWATGFGIHHFYCSYNASSSLGDERLRALLANSLLGDIKFAILYETSMRLGGPSETLGLPGVNLNDPTIFSIIQSDFARIARNYFPHSSYLTINGRPVVYIYATGAIVSDIVTPFAKLRQHLKGLGFEPYFIGDEMEIRWGERIDSKRLQAFDAVTGYTLPPAGPNTDRSASAVRAEYSRWRSAAHAVGVELIPSVYPGYDDHHLVEIGSRPVSHGYVPRSTEFFKTNLKIAKEFIDNSRMLKVSDWNQWGENSYIEPSVADGFKYLQTLRDTLGGKS